MTPTGTEAQVCADIAERQARGIAKYGMTVADNPLTLRQWVQHAYEESLDKSIYLKRILEILDATEPRAKELAAELGALFGGNGLTHDAQVQIAREKLIQWRVAKLPAE